jgi:hypothetical protein
LESGGTDFGNEFVFVRLDLSILMGRFFLQLGKASKRLDNSEKKTGGVSFDQDFIRKVSF